MSSTQIMAAITYRYFQDSPAASSVATIAGPTIAPTAKKPSTVFMNVVCSRVEREKSPINASAPILKTLTPTPAAPSSDDKDFESVAEREQQ